MGFCVARTKKGSGSRCVSPMTVTRRSCIASSSADCVLGEARFISSASTRLPKSGPGWKTNCRRPSTSLRIGLPVMSPGSRSGVNWMRFASSRNACARPFTSSVLPRPGKPSSRRCPRASIPVITCSTSLSWPKRTVFNTSRSRASFALASSISFSVAYSRFMGLLEIALQYLALLGRERVAPYGVASLPRGGDRASRRGLRDLVDRMLSLRHRENVSRQGAAHVLVFRGLGPLRVQVCRLRVQVQRRCSSASAGAAVALSFARIVSVAAVVRAGAIFYIGADALGARLQSVAQPLLKSGHLLRSHTAQVRRIEVPQGAEQVLAGGKIPCLQPLQRLLEGGGKGLQFGGGHPARLPRGLRHGFRALLQGGLHVAHSLFHFLPQRVAGFQAVLGIPILRLLAAQVFHLLPQLSQRLGVGEFRLLQRLQPGGDLAPGRRLLGRAAARPRPRRLHE